jgi:hypothetical protein
MQEAILLELRNMNDDVASNRKDGDVVHNSDMFQKHYATLLLQIKEVNQQVCHSCILLHGICCLNHHFDLHCPYLCFNISCAILGTYF